MTKNGYVDISPEHTRGIRTAYLRRLSRPLDEVRDILSMLMRMYDGAGKPETSELVKYSNSRHYRTLREKYIKAGTICVACGTPAPPGFLSRLCIHHHHYRTLWKEEPGDFCVLCSPCHMTLHGHSRWAGNIEYSGSLRMRARLWGGS